MGIPAHLKEDIFKPFVKADDSRSCQTSGLGLAIAQKIAQAHGGSLTLEDQAASTFIIKLPII